MMEYKGFDTTLPPIVRAEVSGKVTAEEEGMSKRVEAFMNYVMHTPEGEAFLEQSRRAWVDAMIKGTGFYSTGFSYETFWGKNDED